MKRAMRKCLLDGRGKDWVEVMSYIAMGYKMFKLKAVHHPNFFLQLGVFSIRALST